MDRFQELSKIALDELSEVFARMSDENVRELLEEIKNADISSINISLDTLNDQKFKTITQRNHFAKVWENIQRCMRENIHVKLNMVVIKGVNDDEIIDFVNLTKDLPIHIRLIEFMPFDQNNWNKEKVLSNKIALQKISEQFCNSK